MPEFTNLVGIENGRASFAYKCAENGKVLGKDYKSYVKKLPTLIKNNGLGATFGFMLSKHKNEGKIWMQIGEDIYNWLKEAPIKVFNFSQVSNFEKLTGETVKLDSTSYRTLTSEVLAFLIWLKRFSDGLIEGE